MTLLPIVGRELRVAARSRSAYAMRFLAALIAIGAAMVMYLGMSSAPVAEMGMSLFISMTVIMSLVCLLSGLWLTADCLSEEKREGTLGLLFLTDLKGYDVVLGKLAATSINAAFCVLSVLPVLALTILMGGVTGKEVARVAVALVNMLLFSLATGMFVSALCRSGRRAVGLAFVIIGMLAVGLPFLGICLTEAQNYPYWMVLLSLPSAACPVVMAFDLSRITSGYGWMYMTSLLIVQTISWTMLGIACLVVPRSWQEKSVSADPFSLRGRWRRFWWGGQEWRRRYRQHWLALNPYGWLACRGRWIPFLPWLYLAVSALLWFWGWLENRHYWLDTANYVFTAMTLGAILKIWIAGEAGQRFGTDRRNGALELMLVTPLTEGNIIRGQWQALYRQFAGPILAVLAVALVFLAVEIKAQHDWWIWPMGMTVLVADAFTIAWTAMWLSLRTASPHRASLVAILLVLVLPWVFFGLFLVMLEILDEVLHVRLIRMFGNDEFALTLFWFLISLNVDAVLWAWSRRRLCHHFREIAAQPAGKSFFARS